ncbi:uncharacterized protein [Triticum aestivum]|uniref:uncharacterized protein n=1 Tax=Triticum aestivum TaxID=4565 RepID=UPI001D016826|nr:uncharacterized protein LOC123071858 [Triticum aestivum]
MQSSRVVGKKKMALRPRAGATDSQVAGALFDKEHLAVTLGAAVRWKALCLFQKTRRIGGSIPPSSPAARRRQKRRSPGDDERSKEDDLQGRSTYATKILLCTSILHTLLSSWGLQKNGSMRVMVSDLRPGKRKGNLRT